MSTVAVNPTEQEQKHTHGSRRGLGRRNGRGNHQGHGPGFWALAAMIVGLVAVRLMHGHSHHEANVNTVDE